MEADPHPSIQWVIFISLIVEFILNNMIGAYSYYIDSKKSSSHFNNF